jgi:hypothetical protein
MWKSIEKEKFPNKANSADAKTARLICDVGQHKMRINMRLKKIDSREEVFAAMQNSECSQRLKTPNNPLYAVLYSWRDLRNTPS